MKKIIVFLLMIGLTFSLYTVRVHADIGPKATADIKVIGIDQNYYFDILIYYNENISALEGDDLSHGIEQYYQNDYPVDVLNGYQDEDGYASRTLSYRGGAPAHLLRVNGSDDTYRIGYFHAPDEFKVAIVTEDGVLLTSEVIHRKLFSSKMTYDVSGVDLTYDQSGVGIIQEHIPYTHMSISLIIRVILTVLIELLVLVFIFKYQSIRSMKLVGFVNVFTQTGLTVLMMLGYYFWGSIFGLIGMLLLGEVIVFVVEMIVYAIWLEEKGRKVAIFYGLVANFTTLILTIFTMALI